MSELTGLKPTLLQALENRGYASLTPVQQAVLAPELRDVDALVSAQTGSGKTVAFGLNLAPNLLGEADRFAQAQAPLALIIAPTRELALQVKREFEWLYEYTGAKIASCVGGMDMRTERKNLERGAHIVVGTPGRLRDHIERGYFDTSGLKAVVLDEADEMLDLGFREELECILDTTPEDRRTLMFSATVGRGIANLAKRYQRNAVRVTTSEEQKQHVDIEYRSLLCAPNDRENAIINILRYYDARNSIIFCATRATVNHMTSRLTNRGFSVVALSGELSQNERSHALQAMRDGRARVCVATDVAARGIDLPGLELVIHADIPRNSEALLHRSGRTGRAGSKGVSALVVPFNQRRKTERLLQHAKVEADWAKPPSADEVLKQDRDRFLNDAAFSEEIQESEQAFVTELMEKFTPEQIAARLIRLQTEKLPAPEELLDRPEPKERDRKEKAVRVDFEDGVWFSMSVGRKHNAEPRWLLPMLCRAGHITKSDIGAIKIQQEVTYVELAPGAVEKFQEAIGPTRKIEKSVTVDRLDGMPDLSKDTGPKRRPRNRKSFDGDRPARKPHRKNSDGFKKDGDKPRGKPKKSYKPKGKKDTGGMAPIKRKKPKKKD
ncbi:DEAD/DEAH box helicase [Terasakiella sp. A23]|uniref:DEAD/DEAH box helicase n=1 Tax=Terasakiella sp. FCG-A23 TaxID=3080561 RepID=UPI00295440AC|nr:DEAD/DEAH box helicase [Terasakiella sp. A23]MDV7338926.1 DEAD/DEAH box helicase [Terasakiella sp. A23]